MVLEHSRRDQRVPTSYNLSFMTSKGNAFCVHTKQETMDCSCGEEEKDFAWLWSTEGDGQAGSIVLGPECRQISFNPEYSSGTAAVRGNMVLPTGYHHYWELKMTSAVYGTNIMVGVCTAKCDIKHGVHRFCSLLGRDEESWGYSYTGTIQHGAKIQHYGLKWGQGSIVGIHLDTWRGTLEYFLNREPLGIAFTGLQNKELYPIVTSTSAHSGMKLVSCYMFPHSLQFLSSESLFREFCKKKNVNPEELALPPGLHSYIQNNYWPFIKFVSLRTGDQRLEYVRVRNSKRSHEEEARDLGQRKRMIPHHLYNRASNLLCQLGIRSESSPAEGSASIGENSLSGHECLRPGRSESPPAHRCLRVLFDPNASTQPPPPAANTSAGSSSRNLSRADEVEDTSTANVSRSSRRQSRDSSADVD